MKTRTRLLTIALLAASILPAAGTGILIPEGDWPLCNAGIQMPDCAYAKPLYMLELSDVKRASTWTVTATLLDGSTDILSGRADGGTGYVFNLDFGGIVTHWSVALKDNAGRTKSRR